jgi:magnesium transporter
MIHIVRWNPQTSVAENIAVEALPKSVAEVPADVVYWIDLDQPTAEEEALVLQQFLPVHPLTLEDMTKPRREPEQGAHLPKVEEFPYYLFVIVNPLPPEAVVEQKAKKFRFGKRDRPQLSAVLTHTVLITHHYNPMNCILDGQKFLQRHSGSLGRGPDYVFHLILDGIVDEYTPVVESIADELDKLENRMFRSPAPQILSRLLKLKRRVTFLRKTLILEREVLARLVRGEFHLVDRVELAYYRNVYDHQVRYTELIESAREMVSDLMQTHLAAISNKLNEVMKILTMVSLMGLVCSVIAGIYGMNFKHMPELEWEWGYPMALGMMAVAVLVALGVFKWRKWL